MGSIFVEKQATTLTPWKASIKLWKIGGTLVVPFFHAFAQKQEEPSKLTTNRQTEISTPSKSDSSKTTWGSCFARHPIASLALTENKADCNGLADILPGVRTDETRTNLNSAQMTAAAFDVHRNTHSVDETRGT